ncbi:MAG: metallophosphoesterase [Candidatus Acidiferrales bacterium]
MQIRNTKNRRRKPRLADPLHRLTVRWRQGGVEEYPLSEHGEPHRRALRRIGSEFEITEPRIRLAALPDAFRGFRIVQLTDIHHGVFLPGEMLRHVVALVNTLEPDLIALTGDFITYSRAYIEPVAEILGGLRSKHGTFAALGNHDFRVGADEVAGALAAAGIDVLRNAHTRLRRRGQSLYIAGIDDLYYRADLDRAMRGVPRGASSILLSHNPGIIRAAARAGVPLVLSGHTHGGQVNIPFLGNIWGRSPEQLQFKVGWGRLGNTQIYVSRGIGTIVLPVRYRCPAEIPHLALDAVA